MKCNYETHISDLENQVLTLQHINSELKEITKPKATTSTAIQTDKPAMPTSAPTQVVKPSSAKSVKTQLTPVQPANSQLREDSVSHLVATVRGLTTELSQKEKVIARMGRELDDSKKLVAKLQKEGKTFMHISKNYLLKKRIIEERTYVRTVILYIKKNKDSLFVCVANANNHVEENRFKHIQYITCRLKCLYQYHI